MTKKLLTLLTLVSFSLCSMAQQFVLSGAANKHAIVEEFTGINCVNCPAGHTEMETILAANPGLVHAIAWPPTNSSYTTPSNGGADFRRSFADALYTSTYCSPGNGSRFMPSAFVNRKLGTDGNILQSRNVWSSMATAALSEAANLNVAVKSEYNTTTKMLTVDVQAYYINTVNNANNVYVLLTQDDLTSSYQSGSSATVSNPYIYKHTFREAISAGQWGDPITGPKTQGSLFSKQYIFDANTAIDPIDMEKAHIVVMVVDAGTSNYEVLNVISASANGGAASTGSAPTAVNDLMQDAQISIYPNPSTGDVNIDLGNLQQVDVSLSNMVGQVIYTNALRNNTSLKIDAANFPSAGIYFVTLSNESSSVTKKVVIQ